MYLYQVHAYAYKVRAYLVQVRTRYDCTLLILNDRDALPYADGDPAKECARTEFPNTNWTSTKIHSHGLDDNTPTMNSPYSKDVLPIVASSTECKWAI